MLYSLDKLVPILNLTYSKPSITVETTCYPECNNFVYTLRAGEGVKVRTYLITLSPLNEFVPNMGLTCQFAEETKNGKLIDLTFKQLKKILKKV